MSDYVMLAMRTAKAMPTPAMNFAHAALGLVDESYELLLTNGSLHAIEEIGDLCWFIALAGETLGTDPFGEYAAAVADGGATLAPTTMACAERALRLASIIAGRAKKWLVYGQEPSEGTAGLLVNLVALAARAAEIEGHTLERVQELNIAKLAARFPDGFSDWNANNRDTVAEYVAMKEA